jgi:hypothetical protein
MVMHGRNVVEQPHHKKGIVSIIQTCEENSYYLEELMRRSQTQQHELIDLKLRCEGKKKDS